MGDERIEWVTVATFAARYLAEIPIQTLEAQGIPVLVKGQEPGIWGPAFSGPTSGGLRLQVPAAAEEEAREILGGLVVEEGEEGEEDQEDQEDQEE